MNDRTAPTTEDLLATLECCVDGLWMAAYGYMGAAGHERDDLDALWAGCFAGWTDAEGQRVANWLAHMSYCCGLEDENARTCGFAKSARHIHRLVLQKLMRGYQVQWPPEGLMLEYPKPQPDERGPRNLRRYNNIDVEPGYWSSITVSGSDGSGVTTFLDEHGHIVREEPAQGAAQRERTRTPTI